MFGIGCVLRIANMGRKKINLNIQYPISTLSNLKMFNRQKIKQ